MRNSRIGIAALTAACAIAVGFGGSSAWAATPHAHAKPSRHLSDADSVTVRWRGFDPTQDSVGLVIAECTPAYKDDGMQTHCDLNPADLVVINPATVSGTSPFTVHTGTVGDGTCGTTADDVSCLVAVMGMGVGPPPGPVAGQSATAPIRFAKP